MENPIIEWKQKSQKKYLAFTFNERFTEQDAFTAVEKWQKSFTSYPGEKIVLVWNCLKMKGYDSGARTIWQNALKEMKNQIDSIWLVTDSSIIRMGASVMALFASFEMKVVSSENDVLNK